MGASWDEGRGAWWAVWGVTDVKLGNPDYISPNHLFPECSWTELHPWGPDIYQMDRKTGWTRAFRVQPGWSCWLLLWLLKLEDLVFRFLLFCPISSFFGLRSRLHGPQRPFQVWNSRILRLLAGCCSLAPGSSAGGPGFDLGQGTKILQAVRCSQNVYKHHPSPHVSPDTSPAQLQRWPRAVHSFPLIFSLFSSCSALLSRFYASCSLWTDWLMGPLSDSPLSFLPLLVLVT